MNVIVGQVIIMTAFNKIQHILKDWYAGNKRKLPWRQTQNPYNIWISEIILQQTQVKQGTNYYLRFIACFPDIKSLAEAEEQEVLKLWQGLGYYSRARNLHAAAKHVVSEFNGRFPKTYHEIRSLKGIGEYTAAAVGSIAFNLPYAALDGNVARVIARLFGIKDAVNSTKGKKELSELAKQLLDEKNPGEHNQAMMEFGALYCTPKNPDCTSCVLNDFCVAYHANMVDRLPVKLKKPKQRKRFFLYKVFVTDTHTWLQKRNNNDIWKGLYEFPVTELQSMPDDEGILETIREEFKGLDKVLTVKHMSDSYKHILSHQVIEARFIVVNQAPPKKPEVYKIKKNEISGFPVSRLTERFLEDWQF